MTIHVNHLIGVSLGPLSESRALALLERTMLDEGNAYSCRHLKRWPIGTPYHRTVEGVLDLCASPQLQDPVLVVNQTGVGKAVVDLFRYPITIGFKPVTVTNGDSVTWLANGEVHVPRKDLVGTLQVLLGHRRLTVVAGLPETQTLVKELQTFRAKAASSAGDVLGANREGPHDDLLMALAVAAWVGESNYGGPIDATVRPEQRSLVSLAMERMGAE